MSLSVRERKMSGQGPASTLPPLTLSFSSAQLTRALRRQLSAPEDPDSPVIWSEGDSSLVVYPQELCVALQPGLALVELPVASDQTGKSALVVAFSLGKSPQDATLLALTELTLRGDQLLASRWSYAVQEVLWQGLLKSVQESVSRLPDGDGLVVSGLFATKGDLHYVLTRPIQAQEVAQYYEQVDRDDPEPLPPLPVPSRGEGCVGILLRILRKGVRLWLFDLLRQLRGRWLACRRKRKG